MSRRIDETHDPDVRSWVESANRPGCDFPLQNLPFGIFKRKTAKETPHAGVAIGDRILDLSACHEAGLLAAMAGETADAFAANSLNRLMALGSKVASHLRQEIWKLLREPNGRIQAHTDWKTRLLPLADSAEMLLPVTIGDYTDFYASMHHATHVGRLFRPDQPLMPNYKYVPVGYHGRASSVVVSPTPVRRPRGQIQSSQEGPFFAASEMLDYEAEVGFFVGTGNQLGEPLPISEAEDHLFGICLLNDWSARDIQRWEYQPLGPFLAKSFSTSLAPWLVTLEALEPFRGPAFQRPAGDPDPLPYLHHGSQAERAGLDVTIEAFLSTSAMRRENVDPIRLGRGHSRDLYWTPGQILTHHASNGCNLRPGDLLGSGTISGPARENEGCLLELTRGGREPIAVPGGETRQGLADGDEVILRGSCEAEGFARIGMGECRGRILPALG